MWGGEEVILGVVRAADCPPIQQACVVLKSSKNQQLAAKFEAYLRSDEVKKIFERFGFEVPTSADKAGQNQSAGRWLLWPSNQPTGSVYSQPLVRAILAASVRFAAPNLLIASER